MIYTESDILDVVSTGDYDFRELVLRCLEKRVLLTEWESEAFRNHWEPPHNWYDHERDQIEKQIRNLSDSGKLITNLHWKIKKARACVTQ